VSVLGNPGLRPRVSGVRVEGAWAAPAGQGRAPRNAKSASGSYASAAAGPSVSARGLDTSFALNLATAHLERKVRAGRRATRA
jgi:hypothetical protein